MRIRLLLVFLCAVSVPSRAEVGIRVLLGVTDREPAKWDGSAGVSPGRVTKIDPWHFSREDEILADNSWKASSRQLMAGTPTEAKPMVSNGVILWLSGENENTEIKLTTAQGDFSLRLSDIPYGKFVHSLKGRVAVDRIPPAMQITSSLNGQDYPAPAMAHDCRITGSIADSHRAAVATAVVTVTEVRTGSAHQVLSNSYGRFELTSMPPGEYRIEIVKPGFKPLALTGLTLIPGSMVTVDLQIQDAEAAETVPLEARQTADGSLLA